MKRINAIHDTLTCSLNILQAACEEASRMCRIYSVGYYDFSSRSIPIFYNKDVYPNEYEVDHPATAYYPCYRQDTYGRTPEEQLRVIHDCIRVYPERDTEYASEKVTTEVWSIIERWKVEHMNPIAEKNLQESSHD